MLYPAFIFLLTQISRTISHRSVFWWIILKSLYLCACVCVCIPFHCCARFEFETGLILFPCMKRSDKLVSLTRKGFSYWHADGIDQSFENCSAGYLLLQSNIHIQSPIRQREEHLKCTRGQKRERLCLPSVMSYIWSVTSETSLVFCREM